MWLAYIVVNYFQVVCLWRPKHTMASPTRWTWIWASSMSWWWIGKPGVLQSMGSQRVGHDWATELTDSAWLADGHHLAVCSRDFFTWAEKGNSGISSSSLHWHWSIMQVPSPWLYLTLIISQRPPSPDSIILGVRDSTYKLWMDTNVQSLTLVNTSSTVCRDKCLH